MSRPCTWLSGIRVFATIAITHESRVAFAYAPVVLDAQEGLGTIRFHLAKVNPVAGLANGARLSLSFAGPDAYISPDWYETRTLVPTWNYIAVEGEGTARGLDRDRLLELLTDLSAQEEDKLRPKAPWTIDKVPAVRLEAMLNAIAGFEVRLDRLQGKFKLSQDKGAADVAGVMRGLDARGDVASRAVATAMRRAAEGR